MKVLLDTSVLVPALVEAHPRHSDAFEWLRRAHGGEIRACVAAHSLAEVYSVLTRLPAQPRISPAVALRLICEDILHSADIVALTAQDYLDVIISMADLGVGGGATYDALIAQAATLAQVDALVTANPKHFHVVCPSFADRIVPL